jgi:hypothetical protein
LCPQDCWVHHIWFPGARTEVAPSFGAG